MLPALTVCLLFVGAIEADDVATDFRQFYGAASAILSGESPYLDSVDSMTVWGGPYPYPPLPALVAIPLTALPLEVAGLLVMVVLVAVALAVPWVLGVRDWRCYGLLLLWPPVISAIQTGNVTLWFALAAAIAWRLRDRLFASSASIGITLAAKFFLWPLVVWLAATRRMLGALVACAVGVAVLVLSWLVIGFAGMADYPDLLHRLDRAIGEDSYTVYIVGLDLGLPSVAARALWLAVGLASGRRGRTARASRGRTDGVCGRDRGIARAHADRVASLLRVAARRRCARSAASRVCLVRAAGACSSRRAVGIRLRSTPPGRWRLRP